MNFSQRCLLPRTLLLSAAIWSLAVALSGCSAPVSGSSDLPSAPDPQAAEPAPKRDADRAAAESAALAIIKDASTYEDSMNARIVTDPSERLDPKRRPALTVVVRIDRDGREVDLSYMRFTKGFNTVVFGAKGGIPVRGYDHRILTDGDAVLDLVEKLAASPSQSR